MRNYCLQGRIDGAFLTGKTWNIPADAAKPRRRIGLRRIRIILGLSIDVNTCKNFSAAGYKANTANLILIKILRRNADAEIY